MDIKFKSLQELYNRLKPALSSKARELSKKGYSYIHEEDIWNYLKKNKWSNSSNLDLGSMVNDIFLCDERELDYYVKNILERERRRVSEE